MKPKVYISVNERTSPLWGDAFAVGCNTDVAWQFDPESPWASFGSPVLWDQLTQIRKNHVTWYYGDHGYMGRNEYYRCTKNAFQHSGVGEPDFKRLKKFYDNAKPWRKGSHILICVQSESYYERLGYKPGEWLANVRAKLKLNTDRKILVRAKRDFWTLREQLDDAWCVITHSSACAIESLMEGVPVIVTGDSAASCMGLSDPVNVEFPFYPDNRMEWAATLAANQWTLEEIRQGMCWAKVQ